MRKHICAIVVVAFIVILSFLASASSNTDAVHSGDDWAMFLHDATHSSATGSENTANSARLLWKATVMDEVVSSPAVADGRVFVGSNDGAIYCLNQSSGRLLWFFYQNKTEMISSPAVSNGRVYIGCNNGDFFALNETNGMELWNFTTGGWVGSSPTVSGDVVYVGSRDGNLYALNIANGVEIWSFKTGAQIDSSPAFSNGVVYVASGDFFVYAVNASSGKELWQTHTGSTFSSPSVFDGYVYVGSYDGWVCALNASTGAHVWSYLTPDTVVSSPAVAYGCVFIGSEDNNVYCFNASTGSVVWKSPTGYWVTSSPAVAGGNVYVGSEDGNIYGLNASTGAKEWIYQTGNYVESSPAIVNDTLFVGSDDFHIYALTLFNSSVKTLPTSIPNASHWTTVALDAAAFVVAAIIVFAGVLFFRSVTRDKNRALPSGPAANRMSWLSRHVDAIFVTAILAFSLLLFVNLGNGHLVAADEQTYSQWTFHMIKTGDYMTPWAFGALFWVGKPPLVMWLMSLSYQIFGVTNFAARFWSPIFGALSLVAVFFLGKKLYNRYVGLLSTLVLGTFGTFYQYSRLAMTDVPLVFFILCSIYFFISSEKGEHTNRNAALGGLFLGLALMTKQFEALLVLLIVFVYLVATRKSLRFVLTRSFTLFWGVGLLVFSPWVIYMAARFGSTFWQWYFLYDIVSRSVGVVENHVGTYLFYFNYLARNESPIWLVLLPIATALCVFGAVARRNKADTLILFWMAIVLLVFSVAQSKLDWYIIPVLPAFALAIGSLIYSASKKTYLLLRKIPFQRGQTQLNS